MPLPLALLTRAAASGGGSSSVSGKIGHVEDMTEAFLADAKGALEKAIMKGGVIVQRETKILLNKNKGKATGERKTDKKGKFKKQAKSRSKAGEVPFKQTGTLARSIQVEGARTSWGEFVARVGATAPAAKYGKALELGTENMQPRPYLRPAFDNKQKEIIAVIQAGIKEVSKGGA
jgi:HK97 gp10 family phage protein